MKNQRKQAHRKTNERGAILMSAFLLMLVLSILVAGVGVCTVSHSTRAYKDSNYSAAISLAEAGINYEIRTLTQSAASAHQSPGTTVTLGSGSFTVYTANEDGTTPFVTTNTTALIVAAGTVDSVTRTIRVKVKSSAAKGDFAIYTMESVSVWNGSSASILGDIGTNGQFDFHGTPTITGGVYFEGPSAGFVDAADEALYNVTHDPNPIEWPTVKALAIEKFGADGLNYVAAHNDNSLADPPIASNSITNNVTLKGKSGGANYYLTNINLTGSKKIIINNTDGPVNIWIGPEGNTSVARWRGGTSVINNDPTKKTVIYCASLGGIDIAGNERLDASIYCYNKNANGVSYGYVLNSGNPVVYGSILANQADINGNITINYKDSGIAPISTQGWRYDSGWRELNPR